MQKLLKKLEATLPGITFSPGKQFAWSPEANTITYKKITQHRQEYTWALLHEAAHASLFHKTYASDFELLMLETAAWEKAKELGDDFSIQISEDHIQDCLDTYRDWVHQRATCPRCSTVSFQDSPEQYTCHNCSALWRVTNSRFCRPYRISNPENKKSPKALPQATFQ